MLHFSKTLLGALAVSAGLASSLLLANPAAARSLNVGVKGELASFDTSQVMGGVWESQILQDVYEGLLKNTANGDVAPGMATSWDISKDGKTYTFHMRPDAKWSDGTPLTADDFVFGWQHLLDPKSASDYSYMLYPITNAEAISKGKMPVDQLGVKSLDNGKILQVTLNQPTPYFLQILTHYTSYPQPKHLFDKYGKDWIKMDHIATNGAFKPEKWVSHDHISVVKNPDYYEANQVALDGVNFYNAEDANAAVTRFRSGDFDLSPYPSNQYKALKSSLKDAVHQSAYLGTEYYALNARKGHATSDVRVREALSLAVRRDVLSKSIMGGTFLPSTSFVPPGIKGYTPQSADDADGAYQQRLEKAKQLLQEAGYSPSHPLTLNLRYNTNDDWRRIAVAVSAMWKPLGVKVKMINAEAAIHYSSVGQGDFDVARASWIADYKDPQNFLSLMQTGVPKNYSGYSNPEYDKLMAESDVTQDAAKRNQLMEQAEKIGMNEYALLPLLTYVSQNLVNPDLRGWQDNVMDTHPSRYVSFDK